MQVHTVYTSMGVHSQTLQGASRRCSTEGRRLPRLAGLHCKSWRGCSLQLAFLLGLVSMLLLALIDVIVAPVAYACVAC